ncbi:energy-coupling factor transporter ATPase [Thermomicrobiaceae bacterium CFH 74404]|uniref:Energy-coupling factor transporter ATPase n=1 Tax=Thermalbibacter longus TaxID=2951981 RepID=A0AA41WER1_9BACT|nr:energy-coupling factor transporter ATPase [Thermalbibacter longus]MCM8749229.1 energy-coupling factor transporter ATPase [Thermalbibacter longus]
MDATAPGEPPIRFERFTFRYPPVAGAAPVTALEEISLEVAAGEFLGITGSTGSGKSTLCLAIAGLVPQETGGIVGGSVVVTGWDTRYTPVPQLATRVGVVFQDPESNLVGLSVEDEVAFGPENLGIPPAEIARRVDWALEVVGLSHERNRLSAHLSGGQKQRLAIAAVLAMQPQILVLDEPTAQLDPVGKEEVIAAVERLRQELGRRLTIVLVESDTELLSRFADRIVVLHAGRVALEGSPRAVFSRTQELAALGIRIPPLAELAARLNRALGAELSFLSQTEAEAALARLLEQTGLTRSNDQPPRAGHQERPAAEPVPAPRQARAGSLLTLASERDDQTLHAREPASLIEIEDARYRYGGVYPALNGVSLRIGAGEFLALIGPNGSGKTTLAKHCNGLLRPESGRVLVAGQDTRTTHVGQLARTVGYAFQNPDHQLFLPSVAEELAYGPRNLGLRGPELRARVDEALERFGLAELRNRHPTLLGRGLRQLVAIAAVYALSPRLLILDEPTCGLDGQATGRLMATIEELVAEGRSVLLITHDLRLVAEHARRVVLVHEGRILGDGPPRQILTDEALLARAGMAPLTIARLSRGLSRYGILPSLTEAELAEAVLARLAAGTGHSGLTREGGPG